MKEINCTKQIQVIIWAAILEGAHTSLTHPDEF